MKRISSLRLDGNGRLVWPSMALHSARISESHVRKSYHARPITWDVSRGSNLGHGRGVNLSWPIGTVHGHLWPDMERELLLMRKVKKQIHGNDDLHTYLRKSH